MSTEKEFKYAKGDRCRILADYKVEINSKAMLGASETTINVNSWEVYDAESVEALKLIAKTVTVPEWTR